MGRPFTGAWIETFQRRATLWDRRVAPSQGRGLKLGAPLTLGLSAEVAPSQGRGLKLTIYRHDMGGARVAPSQGRGLKPGDLGDRGIGLGRPFTGAWIETR